MKQSKLRRLCNALAPEAREQKGGVVGMTDYRAAIADIQDMLDVVQATGSCYAYKHNGGDARLRNVLACLRAQLERENPQPDGGTPEDLVQVVRCARCQWWWKARKAGFCNHPKCDTMRVTRPDFYCAAGETAEMEETT